MLEELELRKELVTERLSEIEQEVQLSSFTEEYRRYFLENAERLCKLIKICDRVTAGQTIDGDVDAKNENRALYEPYLPEHYDTCFTNPAYAVTCFGADLGQLLSFLAVELYSVTEDAVQGDLEELVIRAELFLEVYGMFCGALDEGMDAPKAEDLREVLYWFVSDYSDMETEKRIRSQVDADCPQSNFYYNMIMNSELTDTDYLYRYGCYITENELRTAKHLNELPQETIDLMADTFTEGYRMGFVLGNKDLSKKETVNIRYCAGFERVIRKAITNFEQMGLRTVIYKASDSIFHKKGNMKIGFYGAIPNKQMDYDHREDDALFFDGGYKTRKLETLKEAYELVKDKARKHAGPACMEVFGEVPFEPVNTPEALRLSESQQKRKVEYQQAAGAMVNAYIPGEERSFTIIAFPVPEIGAQYEEIFDEIIRINTLDYHKYAKLQEMLIAALDKAEYVQIKGMNGNHTDLRVKLCKLDNPEKQTKFENCVADVNIPVGEVFTSPVLAGTNGVLHVSRVYLNELLYEDLEVQFVDGMTEAANCKNFADEEANRRYVKENVLFHHASLPLGEFAIGTNTTAYVVAQKYGIADKLPILIAEKMGPHFAVGDTCYSHAEDVAVYNPDGKEIVARDNEVSLRRKEDPSKAYFNCHTDITIPYDELGSLVAVCADGKEIEIIRAGRFVLAGCEALNEPFA